MRKYSAGLGYSGICWVIDQLRFDPVLSEAREHCTDLDKYVATIDVG